MIAAWEGRYFVMVLNAALAPDCGTCPQHTATEILVASTLPPPMTVVLLFVAMVDRQAAECRTLLAPAMCTQPQADTYAHLYADQCANNLSS